jgi:cyclopropane-fatty-acyl-phospholipid synthase
MSDTLSKRIVLRLLHRLRGGELVLHDGAERMLFGAGADERAPRAVIEVRSQRFYTSLLRGSIGLCESYVRHDWECDDLVSLIRLAARNVGALDRLRRAFAPALIPAQRLRAGLRGNTIRRSRSQIAAHYDLGNELFALFLDPTMMYSAAIFDSPNSTLEEASVAKLERVCAKLDLSPADHVLEIGTGWGGFALHAATRHGCRVTTTTISPAQHAYAVERVRSAGLEKLVTVLLEDYRSLQGRYDKLVSIEMIEAVGWRHFNTFFRACSGLVADHGSMLLQAIVIDDRAYEVEKAGRSFINTYIFPGGCLPSLEVISRSLRSTTDLRHVHLEDITEHYAHTLAHWRARFHNATQRLEELGYDERFRRLWTLYLCYSEAGFRERRIRDVQLLLAKPAFRGEARLVGGITPDAKRLIAA